MQDTKLFTLLRTLRDKEELESFDWYLKHLHGNERAALAVFGYVRKFHPDYRDDKKLDAAYICKKVFPAETGQSRKKILNILSELHGWLKAFLLSEKMTGNSLEGRFGWLAVLYERGWSAEFSRQASRLRQDVNALPKKHPLDYLKAMAANYFIHCRLEQTEFLPGEDIETDLDLFYVLAKIKLACEKANFKNLRPEAPEWEPLPSGFDFFPAREGISQHPLLLLYREVYQLIAIHWDESFDRLETLLPEHTDNIDAAELNLILRYLHNYAARQIRKGREEYWKRIHHLNKFNLDRGVFTPKGVILGAQFNNIVSTACNAKDTAWASAFISLYSPFLPAEVRSEAVVLAEATILFEEKNFNGVTGKLEKQDFRDTFNFIRSKALIIKTHYELDRDDVLDKCHTLDTFLYRHRSPRTDAMEGTLNFSKILQWLVRKKMGKDFILDKIRTVEPLYFRSWLLEKVKGYNKI